MPKSSIKNCVIKEELNPVIFEHQKDGSGDSPSVTESDNSLYKVRSSQQTSLQLIN